MGAVGERAHSFDVESLCRLRIELSNTRQMCFQKRKQKQKADTAYQLDPFAMRSNYIWGPLSTVLATTQLCVYPKTRPVHWNILPSNSVQRGAQMETRVHRQPSAVARVQYSISTALIAQICGGRSAGIRQPNAASKTSK